MASQASLRSLCFSGPLGLPLWICATLDTGRGTRCVGRIPVLAGASVAFLPATIKSTYDEKEHVMAGNSTRD